MENVQIRSGIEDNNRQSIIDYLVFKCTSKGVYK